MKKTYIEPKSKVVTIGVVSMMCTSTLGMDGDTATGNGGGPITSADSRWFDFDDEDDYDY